MVKLNDLKNIKNKLLKDGVYEFFVSDVCFEKDKIDKNNNKYEMWKFELQLKNSGIRMYKNILIYENENLNKIGNEQLFSLINLLEIDFESLVIEEEELNNFLIEKLKKLELVSIVYKKNGRNELRWLYGIQDKEKLLKKFREEIKKDDELPSSEANQVLQKSEEVDIQKKDLKKEQAGVDKTDRNYSDYIKFD